MTASAPRPSLVFGLVAATGTHLDPFADVFSALLRKYGYEPVPIRLTDLLREASARVAELPPINFYDPWPSDRRLEFDPEDLVVKTESKPQDK